MPEMVLTDDGNGGYPWLSLELRCLMAFPDDESERETARAILILHRQVSKGPAGAILVDSSLLRMALAGEGLERTEKKIAGTTKHGSAAGEILLGLIEQAQAGEVPTVTACVQQLVEVRRRYMTRGGSEESQAERSIRAAWAKFKPVAHFWAAALDVRQRVSSDAEWHMAMLYETQQVIALAMRMVAQVSAIDSSNSSAAEPLFDAAQAWLPPQGLSLRRQSG